MTIWLKQSTSVVISFGPFLLNTDGVTLVINLVGTGANQTENTSTGIRISKNGGAFAARHATATASTYDAFGNYLVTLDTTDTGTLGVLRVQYANAAAFCPVWQDFEIVAANIYDSFIGGGDVLDVSMIQILGTAVSSPATAGILDVNLKNIANSTVSTSSAQIGANVVNWTGTAVATPNTNGVPVVDARNSSGRIATAQAGGASTITLDASASATDSLYNRHSVLIISGTGAGQGNRIITGYVGSTKVATVTPAWTTNPDNTSVFCLVPAGVDVETWLATAVASPATAGIPDVNVKNMNNVAATAITTIKAVQGLTTADTIATYTGNTVQTGDSFAIVKSGGTGDNAAIKTKTDNLPASPASTTNITAGSVTATLATTTGLASVRSNTAQAGSAPNSITLDASASAVNNFYRSRTIVLTGGTGAGQSAIIVDYDGATKIALCSPDFVTTPNNTTTFTILPLGVADVQSWKGDSPGFLSDGFVRSRVESMANGVIDSGNIVDDAFVASKFASDYWTIKKNTALNSFSFLMIDSADHITPKTGLTVTATRSIDGAAFGACANAVTEVSNGFYVIDLAAADLNGNVIALKFTATGADQRSLSLLTQT